MDGNSPSLHSMESAEKTQWENDDASERKRIEAQLAFQAQLLSTVHEAIIAMDENMSVTYWNNVAQEISGWTTEEAIGLSGKEIFRRLGVDSLWPVFTARLDEAGAYDGEIEGTRKNGSQVIIDLHMKRIYGSDGEFKGTVSTFRDVTERKQAEETLRGSEAKFRTVFETMIEACCIFDMIYDHLGKPVDWYILEANAGYEKQSGLKDVAGKLASEVMPGFEAYWTETFGRVAETGEAEQIEKWHQPTGRWVHSSTARVGGSGSRRLASVFYDITERKRAEEALQERAEFLAEIDRAKTAFFTNISHEFRTPLTLILSPLEELLAKPEELPALVREQISLVHGNGLRLLKLVNTLLDFSRIEAGRVQAVYQPTDPAAFTVDLASVFRSAVEKAGLHFIVDCQPLPQPIYIDKEMWEKIVLNLLSNALKFTFEGEIAVALRWCGQHIELEVKDTGIGIAPEEMGHLFERFHRIQGVKARTQEGTGIGLALVQELVKLHGGKVGAVSVPDQGTVFTVVIPTGSAHLPQDRIGGERTLASTALKADLFVQEAWKWIPEGIAEDCYVIQKDVSEPMANITLEQRAKVLLADDNPDMRAYLQRLLSRHYRVEAVADGQEALEAIKQNLPDLVLADIMMPVLDGFGLLKAIRENPVTKTLPVIFLSARAGEESKVEGMDKGADDYLIKPFSSRELMARVAAHLDMARIRKEAAEKIRQSEERFRAVQENSLDRFSILKPFYDDRGEIIDFTYVYQNAKGAKLSGRRPEEFVGLRMTELWPTFPQTRFFAMYKQAAETGRLTEFEDHYLADGVDEWFRATVTPIPDGIAVATQIITERKRAEKALRESEERLTELSRNLASEVEALRLFHQINTRYIRHDEIHSVYSDILDAAMFLTNADCGNLQLAVEDGQALEIIVHRGFSNAFIQYFQRVSGDKTVCAKAMEDKARVIVDEVAGSAVFEDIDVRRVMLAEGIRCVQSTPMFSGSGKFMGMLSTHYKSPHQFNERELQVLDLLARQAADLLERQHADALLRESEMKALALVSELEKADKNKNQFISVLSHELRNPLAAISAGVQLLAITQDKNQTAKVEDIISRQMNQLCKLVDDLLELTRITQNKIKLKKEYIHLSETVKNAVDDMRLAYEKKGVCLRTRIQLKPVWLSADPVRVTQIIGNLLTNALKFTQENGEVWVALRTKGNNAVISIIDNGIGISPEILPRLFTPFTQADSSLERSRGGLGLGLSIVKGIVDLHEGSVTAYSEGLGKGSTFTIRLPLGAEDTFVTENSACNISCGKSKKLLIIEDNRDFSDLLSTMLFTLGHQVDIAYDGIEGVKLAKQIRPDVIFCDIGLPGMNGYDVAKNIRNDNVIKDIRLIALTGYAGEDDTERVLKAGFDMHLAKPVDFNTLKTVL